MKADGAVTFYNSRSCISFITAKYLVVPLKTTTLPRLKLMAAVIGVRITHLLSHQPSVPIHLWVDRQIVMYWILSSNNLPPVFVAHHIAVIH